MHITSLMGGVLDYFGAGGVMDGVLEEKGIMIVTLIVDVNGIRWMRHCCYLWSGIAHRAE